jgi:hypothetical protein
MIVYSATDSIIVYSATDSMILYSATDSTRYRYIRVLWYSGS